MRILLLDLDSLRPDHLGCYGYGRNTSPNIDRIAKDAVRFDNYYCPDAPCLPSRTALMTGRFGIHTGVVGHSGTASETRTQGPSRSFADLCKLHSVPAFLRKAGFRTTTISPFAERHSAWWFNAGFNEVFNTGKGGMESAEEVTPTVLKWVQDNAAQDNWFLHINYWDPHTPYRAPASFGDPFKDTELPTWITEAVLESHKKAVGPRTAQDMSMYDDRPLPQYPRHVPRLETLADLKRHLDGYDTQIAYMDSHLGQLFNALADQNALDDTAIFITADHGENQGELGIYGEHATADQGTCRIPMLVRWPGARAGHVDAGLHYNLDLGPTLAELLDCDPAPVWEGRSYAKSLTEGAETGHEQLVLSQCAHVLQRSVRWDRWLYTRTYHDGFHLFPTEMLYDIAHDPHEQHDLAESHPELCREAAARLLSWHDQMMKTQPEGYDNDPLWTVWREGGPAHAHTKDHLEMYCARLEATGRGWAVPELRRRHGR